MQSHTLKFLKSTPEIERAIVAVLGSMSEDEQSKLKADVVALKVYAELDPEGRAPEPITAGFVCVLVDALNEYDRFMSTKNLGFSYQSAVSEHTYKSLR